MWVRNLVWSDKKVYQNNKRILVRLFHCLQELDRPDQQSEELHCVETAATAAGSGIASGVGGLVKRKRRS